MTVTNAPYSPVKTARLDHPPQVPGTARAARWFSVMVICGTLCPLILGFNFGDAIPRVPAMEWTLAIDSRTASAAALIHQRKIVFIGGSNIRFGVDANALTTDLGMPVVNYGLHASLGMDVITDRALRCVKPGDIVVFAPELSHFRKSGAADFSDDLRIDFLTVHPSSIDPKLQSFPTREWRLSRSRCNRIRSALERTMRVQIAKAIDGGSMVSRDPSPYSVEAVGPDGNVNFPRPAAKPYDRWTLSDPPTSVATMDLDKSRGAIAFQLVRKFCDENHCTLCVMRPLRLQVPQFDSLDLGAMEQAFITHAITAGAIELMKPGENVLPREDGYDTDYHLNDIGVKTMEPRLIKALRGIMNGQVGKTVNPHYPAG